MTEWKECTIADLGMVVGGATPSTKDPENYDGGMIPWITPKDLSNYSDRYISRGERNITEKGLNGCSTQLMPRHSVLFTSRAPIGYIAIADNEVCTNQGFKSVVPNEQTDYLFLYYLLKFNKEKIEGLGSGTTFKEVSGSTMRGITVKVPKSLDVQRAIGRYLDSIDTKIEINRRINENLQAQARALYKAWFIDYVPFRGSCPAGWKTGKLKDVLTLKRNAIKAGENTELPYLPIDVIPMNTFALSDVKPNEEAQSSLITFDKDDIVIGAMRVYFHRVIIAPFAGITRTTCFTLKPSDSDYLCFGLLCCDQDSSIEYAQTTSKGSTMPYAVWDGGLGDMDIVIPDKDTAHEFNEVVMPMIRTIQSSYEEIKHLRDLRDSLLPRLMSGKIDVSELDL